MRDQQDHIATPRYRTRFFSILRVLVPVALSAACEASNVAWGVDAWPAPVEDAYSQHELLASPHLSSPHLSSPHLPSSHLPSPQWFLHKMARLHQQYSPQHAYQMGMIGVALYPSSPQLRAALIHAAIHANRCILAVPHLRVLARLPLSPMIALWRRESEEICLGGWRNSAHISVAMERRKSLGPGNGVTLFAAEPGSRLYGLCTILAGICDPHALAMARPKRQSGFEGLVTISLRSRRLFADRTSTFRTTLLRRFTDNKGFGAHGIGLNFQRMQYISHRRSILWEIEAQTILRNQQAATPHQHNMVGMMVGMLRQWGQRRFSQITLSYQQHMLAPTSFERVAVAWGLRGLLPRQAQFSWHVEAGTSSFEARSRHRNTSSLGLQAKLTLPSFNGITPWVGLMHRTDRYHVPLPYLAGPHSDHHRKGEIGASIALDPDRRTKLTLRAYRHKVISRNPLAARDYKGITLYLSHQLSDSPETKL